MSQTSQSNPIPSQTLCAAEMMEGVELANGWKVLSKVPKPNTATGGCFSVPYFVENRSWKKTQRAFLKALNLRRLAAERDFVKAMAQHTRAFNFEKDTLELCRGKKLTRVAKLLDSGEYRAPQSPWPVAYIIFELADGGDARQQLAKLGIFNIAWTLRTLHQITVGLQQLHGEGIAHQDLKPSNILFFEAFGAKLADLGCADTFFNPSESPRGHLAIAGDPNYAPPELFYNEFSGDWKVRRLGCDHYLLGSLIVFFFTGGASFNAVLYKKVHPAHSPMQWPHDYRSVLPYIRQAFEEALAEVEKDIPIPVRPPVMEILRWLCEPDPKRRGHPIDLGMSQFNLERVISAFNLLATKVEFNLIKI
jgi:eukaryotic-like serine/threonine-protein kinase